MKSFVKIGLIAALFVVGLIFLGTFFYFGFSYIVYSTVENWVTSRLGLDYYLAQLFATTIVIALTAVLPMLISYLFFSKKKLYGALTLVGIQAAICLLVYSVGGIGRLKKSVEFVGELTNSNPEISVMSAIGGSKKSETSLLDLVSAYSVFSNQGVFVKATPNKFYLQNNQKILFPKSKSARIALVASADKTNEMMKLVLSEIGTATHFKREANLSPAVEIAGKTGSGMVADCWFVAITPKIIVGVWVGLPKNEIHLEMSQGFTGGKIAAPIAAKFLQSLQKTDADLLRKNKCLHFGKSMLQV